MKSTSKRSYNVDIYPCLKIACSEFNKDNTNEIVLFRDSGIGTVVQTGSSNYTLGYTCTSWREKECFIPYIGEVVLTT